MLSCRQHRRPGHRQAHAAHGGQLAGYGCVWLNGGSERHGREHGDGRFKVGSKREILPLGNSTCRTMLIVWSKLPYARWLCKRAKEPCPAQRYASSAALRVACAHSDRAAGAATVAAQRAQGRSLLTRQTRLQCEGRTSQRQARGTGGGMSIAFISSFHLSWQQAQQL